MLKRLLCAVTLLCAYASAQTINPNQIRPGTANQEVLTTVTANQPPSWQPISSLGLCGPLALDPTATNCGNGNLVGNTATDVQTFGYTNADSIANASAKAFFGAGNLTASGLGVTNPIVGVGYDNFLIGTIPAADVTLQDAYAFGNQNVNLSGTSTHFSANVLLAEGFNNVCSSNPGNATFNDDYFFGESVFCYTANGGTVNVSNVLAAGDTVGNMTIGTGTLNLSEMVALGDQTGEFGLTNGTDTTHDVVAIGNVTGIGDNDSYLNAIGSSTLGFVENSNNINGIGFQVGGGLTNSHDLFLYGDTILNGATHNALVNGIAIGYDVLPQTAAASLTDFICQGDNSCASVTGGSDFVAIGKTAGGSDATGSNWVSLGDGSGATGAAFSNWAAIGPNAHVTASNQMTLGNSSMTSLNLYGIPNTNGLLYSSGNSISLKATSGTGTNVILPSGTPAAGKYVDGGTFAWTALPGPGGANTNIQFNNSGSFGGDSTFAFNSTSKLVSVAGLALTSTDGLANYLTNGFTSLPSGFTHNTIIEGAANLGTSGFLGPGLNNFVAGFGAAGAAKSLGDSTIIGVDALQSWPGNGGGEEDGTFTCIGYSACASATTGGESIAIGHAAYDHGTGESNSIFIGNHIEAESGGAANTYIGTDILGTNWAINQVFTGTGDTLIGQNIFSQFPAAAGTVTNAGLTFIGYGIGGCMMASSFNVGIGSQAYSTNLGGAPVACPATLPTGSNNVVVWPGIAGSPGGTGPGGALTTGSYNTILTQLGPNSPFGVGGGALTTGSENILIGPGAGSTATTAGNFVAIGQEAGAANNAVDGVFVGGYAGYTNTAGTQMTAVGAQACAGNTTGQGSTCVGWHAALVGSGSQESVVIGSQAIGDNNDVVIGYQATNNSSGFDNTYVGALVTGTGSFNVLLGVAAHTTTSVNNSIAVGRGAEVGASNATEINDSGGVLSNAIANTAQYRSWNFLDSSGNVHTNLSVLPVGTAIASAATIAPVAPIVHITGTTAISTITVPTVAVNGGTFTGCVRLIPDGLWTTTTGGNIALASTAVVGRVLEECYDGTKWYPSY